MLRAEFKNVINEVTLAMCEREPLGFNSDLLKNDPGLALTCVDKTDTRMSVEFLLNGKTVGTLSGGLKAGTACGIEGMQYESEGAGVKSGLSGDILRRFLYGLSQHGVAYVATSALVHGTDTFKKLGFHIVPVLNHLHMHAMRGGKMAELRSSRRIAAKQSIAVIDFKDEPHRRGVFEKLGLPLDVPGGV